MKYLLLLVMFTCCGQAKTKHLEGTTDEIMEQVFKWKYVAYTFDYAGNEIPKKTYSIDLPENASIEEIVEVVITTTGANVELKNGIMIIHE